MSGAALRQFAVRLLVYLAVGALVFQTVVLAVTGGWSPALAEDDGPLELAQIALVATASGLLFLRSRRSPCSHVLRFLGAAGLFAVARELDHFLEAASGAHSSYQLLTTPVGAYGAFVLWRGRGRLASEAGYFLATPAFAFVFSGFFIVVLYAQLFGQQPLWGSVMGEAYLRPVKDLVEETSELLGYFLIAVGALESYLQPCEDGTKAGD